MENRLPGNGPAGPHGPQLTSGSLLARNSVFNLMGLVVPSLVALWAVPALIQGFGEDRFALLTLAWLVIGHASVFDLGIGRALTRAVAEKIAKQDQAAVAGVVRAGVATILLLGIAIGAALIGGAPWLSLGVLNLSVELAGEAATGFRWLGLGMPAVVVTAALRGLLEAQQRFGLVALLRAPAGILMFVGPLAVLLLSERFDHAVVVLVVIRTALTATYLLACFQTLPVLRTDKRFAWNELGDLFRFGSWTTIAAGVGMAMDYATRFFIGAALPIAFVAYFATPSDILVKLLVIPGAILGVIFPAIAMHAAIDPARASRLVGTGALVIVVLMFPASAMVIAAAEEILAWWIDPAFAAASATTLQWLTVGGFATALASMPAGALSGINRPELASLPPLIELPFFLLATAWVLQAGFGIAGVAAVVAARATIDGAILVLLMQRVLPLDRRTVVILCVLIAGVATVFALLFTMETLVDRVAVAVLASIVLPIAVVFYGMEQDQRTGLYAILRRR